MSRFPALYQINTRVWLNELSHRLGRRITLDLVPDSELDAIAAHGFEWLWLLGMWQTGPAGRRRSLEVPEWRDEYRRTLADFTPDDVCGSPFAICGYTPHIDFGGAKALAKLRQRLTKRGLKLLLDFVPNHTALDHPWVQEHPEYFLHGTPEDLEREPLNYCRLETSAGPLVLAYGRDPYFPGWPDTLQLNYHHAGVREAMIGEINKAADLCDGVRCDMAMLLETDVFSRTWRLPAGVVVGGEAWSIAFWPEAIRQVRERHPGFTFMAEVYWDLEWALQQHGFDYTYDKRLYDRLHGGPVGEVRNHLLADPQFQARSVRFLENHDEPRAAGTFPRDKHQAAAAVTMFVPGLRFFFAGQLEGRRIKLSVHLGRQPDEPVDEELQTFYERLLECLKRPIVHDGEWRLLHCRSAWDDNPTCDNFVAMSWQDPAGGLLLVTVNYAATQGQCYVELPPAALCGRNWRLADLMHPIEYERAGDDLCQRGLYLDLAAWGYHVFEVTPIE